MLWLRFSKTDAAFVSAMRDPTACDMLIAKLKRERRNGILAAFSVLVLLIVACLVGLVALYTHPQAFLHAVTPEHDADPTLFDVLLSMPSGVYAFLGANLLIGIYHVVALVHDLDHHIKILLMMRART